MAAKSLLRMIAVSFFFFAPHSFSQLYTSVRYQYATLAYPGAVVTTANGINNNNVIVGSYFDRNFVVHGFVYRRGHYESLDVRGATETEALGINDAGDIVGVYQLPGRLNAHGFLRHENRLTTIDDPAAQFSTKPFGINNNGTVVGSFDDSQGFILNNGVFRTFNAPQQPGDALQTQLNAINKQGWMVGQVLSGGNWRGFWRRADALDFLEPLFANDNQVTGINGRGDIVGCHDATSGFVSFHVEASEGPEQNKTFPHQQSLASCASGINYSRVIVGNYFRVGQLNAFIAVPRLTLNVRGPISHSTVSNPVHLAATTTGVNDIWQIQVWVNLRKILFVKQQTLETDIRLPKGQNQRVVVQAVDSKGLSTKVVMTLTVN
jgi:hypothetical protein